MAIQAQYGTVMGNSYIRAPQIGQGLSSMLQLDFFIYLIGFLPFLLQLLILNILCPYSYQHLYLGEPICNGSGLIFLFYHPFQIFLTLRLSMALAHCGCWHRICTHLSEWQNVKCPKADVSTVDQRPYSSMSGQQPLGYAIYNNRLCSFLCLLLDLVMIYHESI